MTGIIIARWMGLARATNVTIKSAKSHAELTAKYVHSALACEFLIGYRYYRNLPDIIDSSSMVIGSDKKSCTRSTMTLDDISPENVAITKTELCETYSAQIDRIIDAVKQYKRGFVGLQTIRCDPQFMRLMHAFWRYNNQLMKIQNDFEESSDRSDQNFDANRLLVVADICKVAAMVPQLCNYDIVHLFDNTKQSYAKLIKTYKRTLVRLSNDGLTAAFLSFAAIEPRMVTAEMAPKHGLKFQTTTMTSCLNHIPTRHPVYGTLRVKHLHHIPRTVDAVDASSAWIPQTGIQRSSLRFSLGYTPLQDTLDDIRAGQPEQTQTQWSRRNRGFVITAAEERVGRDIIKRAALAAEKRDAADGWILCSYRRRK
jgi:hypothetical protein